MISSLLFSSRTTATTDCLYKSKDKSLLRRKRGEEQCVFSERQDVGRKDWVGRKIASLSFGPLSLISPTAPPRTLSGRRPGVGGNFPIALKPPLCLFINEGRIENISLTFRLKSAVHPVVETLFSSGHKFLPPCRFLSDLTIPNPHESGLSLDFAETVLCGTAVGC